MTILTAIRIVPLVLLSVTVLGGTLYSVIYHTNFDTSDPLLANLPHPLQHETLFARKSNIFNVYFVKLAWGWTSAALAAVWLTAPYSRDRVRAAVSQWIIATIVWGSFAAWFFGPSLSARLIIASGGMCAVLLPGQPLAVPLEYCYTRMKLSPRTHPALFAGTATNASAEWTGFPRLTGGHDVSGHIFLLTLSVLLLYTHLIPAWRRIADGHASIIHSVAVVAASALLGLWLVMSLATSMYWHKPVEKLTGFGLAGFAVTQIPLFPRSRGVSSVLEKEQ